MPSADLLWWSRLPMAVLAATACQASFWLMRSLFGTPAAYVALALLALNPWLAANLVRAMAEAPLLCSLLLAVAAAIRLARAARSALPDQFAWLAVAGAAVGVAGSFKLSGLTALAGVAAVWIVVVTLAGPYRPPLHRAALLVAGFTLLVSLAGATLVLLNPFLDPDPLGRFIKLLQFRAEEMRGQLQMSSAWPVKGVADRLQFIFGYVFEQAVLLRHPIAGIASIALCLVGLGTVLRRTHATFKQQALHPAGAALLVALTAAGPMLATPLKWDRYLFLPVWFTALLVALGTTVCAQWLLIATIKRRAWRAGASLDETPGWPRTRPES